MNRPTDQHQSRQVERALVEQALVDHQRWLTTVVRARGVESHAVDDLMQEISTAAIENASKLRDTAKVAPWLYRIAVTAALQHRRRMGRKRRLVERFAETRHEANADTDPLDWLLADERQQLVRRALGTLSSRDAEILLLKHTEDWSYRQLAQHLGISQSAVDARLHRARAKMRQALAVVSPTLVPR
ncbi:MAG: sigma-70 family RNA polymerase sigma factor [Planctomycetota bacterium]